MKISEKIRTGRKELKLTQEQVADYLGVSAPAVNKWEKGVSYPDITLLPPLARLLNTDLNTLLSFEEEMTESEIGIFCNRIYVIFGEEGYEAGYRAAIEKIKEFPNCSLLIYSLAGLLKGALIMFPVEAEKERGYEAEIQELLERVVNNGGTDAKTRDGALSLLVIYYIQQKEYDKAEALLAKMPDPGVDKGPGLIMLYRERGKYEEALKLARQRLLKSAGDVQNYLLTLREITKEQGNREASGYYGDKCKAVIELLELWEYGKYAVDFDVVLSEKNPDKTVEMLKNMLESLERPWEPEKSRLYEGAVGEQDEKETRTDMYTRLRSRVMQELENSEEFDYVRDREDFKECISQKYSCKP